MTHSRIVTLSHHPTPGIDPMYATNAELPAVKDIPVWVVDDHLDYRETIQDLINDSPGMHCLHTFESCEDMLAMLTHIPPPGIILMDIGIPGKMSGIEGVEKVQELISEDKLPEDVRIVMLTIHSDDDKIFQALCAGASGYMLKMSPPEDIVDAVFEADNGGVAMTPQVAQRVLKMFRNFAVPQRNYDLTKREKEVLELLAEGLPKKRIADKLFVAYTTIDTHIQNIYSKLHVHSATHAVSKAIRERLI